MRLTGYIAAARQKALGLESVGNSAHRSKLQSIAALDLEPRAVDDEVGPLPLVEEVFAT
jgi:hypothetical protein